MNNKIKVYPTAEMVARQAADFLFTQITDCVEKQGQCHVVLPGGSTPAHCLSLLAQKALPWSSIHWYPGDERCYPVGHAERNDTMLLEKLFSGRETIDNLHPIPAEEGPERGAERYRSTLADTLGNAGFDLVVLGMGEDGHTASLFPGNVALDDERSVVPVFGAPKPPLERISISLKMLEQANRRVVITTGESKREALMQVRQGSPLPVARVSPDYWFIDQAADVFDH